MALRLDVERICDHLVVTARGHAVYSDYLGMISLAAAVARKDGFRRILFDFTDVERTLSFTDHLAMGAYAAEELRHIRVATVVVVRDKANTSEKSAQNHGLNVRTFFDRDQALIWLTATARSDQQQA